MSTNFKLMLRISKGISSFVAFFPFFFCLSLYNRAGEVRLKSVSSLPSVEYDLADVYSDLDAACFEAITQ